MANIPENVGQTTTLAQQAQNCSPAPKWAALVDDESIPMPQQIVKASVIKAQAEFPLGLVLVRDYDSPDDTVLADDEAVVPHNGVEEQFGFAPQIRLLSTFRGARA